MEGMGASMSIEGPSDTESFGRYMREILAPRLEARQIVLMDNLSVHRSSRWVREIIEERLRLPAMASSQLLAGAEPHRRGLLQSEEPPEKGEGKDPSEKLFEAPAEALWAVSAGDARGYFEYCGYTSLREHSLRQPL
jgi:hypothetical protein